MYTLVKRVSTQSSSATRNATDLFDGYVHATAECHREGMLRLGRGVDLTPTRD